MAKCPRNTAFALNGTRNCVSGLVRKAFIRYIPAKTLVSGGKDSSPWFGVDYNKNIYRGCCHGCIYCDSRSECYRIDNFDEVRAKENALAVIRRDLAAKKRTGVVGTGAMSDPYNPFERELCLTRQALELLGTYRFGAAIATKSDLIVRDIDVLKRINSRSPVICKITVTACDDGLCSKIEPHAPVSSRRFAAVKALADAGIYAGILMMPVLPFLEDNIENISGIIRAASQAGARFIYPAFGVTLRQKQREWYYRKLDALFPQENLRSRYIRRYGNSYECSSPEAGKLWRFFSGECRAAGILYRMEDIIASYKNGYRDEQMSLF